MNTFLNRFATHVGPKAVVHDHAMTQLSAHAQASSPVFSVSGTLMTGLLLPAVNH
jgi:hypothetical protein